MNWTVRITLLMVLSLGIAGGITGCVVHPTVLTNEQIGTRIKSDKGEMFNSQEPVQKPISLHEAAARALKYNLDYRLKIMEDALYLNVFKLTQYDMLPGIMASAGYSERDNDSGGVSVSLARGTQSLEPSTSQERRRFNASAGFSWNILDFGISYMQAKQNADQFLIAQERRRKVIQNVLQDVRAAYYRALSAQKLLKKTDELLAQVANALERSSQAEIRGLLPPVESLTYQRTLIEIITLLTQKRLELHLSKTSLAALMNLAPGTDFELDDVELPRLPEVPADAATLEETALALRPELREEDYKSRITAAEARKAILKIFPSMKLDYLFQYDSNKFLYNQHWLEAGVQTSFNLMKILALPAIAEVNESQKKVDDTRRMALSMAVITQIGIAAQQYGMAKYDYELWEKASNIDEKLSYHARSAAKTGLDTELELIRAKSKALLSEIQKYSAYANVQAAYARIFNSLGFDILPVEDRLKDINDAAAYMGKTFSEWDKRLMTMGKKQSGIIEIDSTSALQDKRDIRRDKKESAASVMSVISGTVLEKKEAKAPDLQKELVEDKLSDDKKVKKEGIAENNAERVNNFVEKWRRSWEGKDLDEYIKCYSQAFKSRGMDLGAWKKYKASLWKNDKASLNKIVYERRISISGIRISREGNNIVVSFKQRYTDEGKNYTTIKYLYLEEAGEDLKIVREELGNISELKQ